jgi:plasmid stabilization system protein ParE
VTRPIVFTQQARADLDEIFDFIQIDNPLRAISYID